MAKANLYHTQWGNRQFSAGVDANSDGEFDETAIFDNVAQLHQGVELELTLQPPENLSINGMASLGNWRYTDHFEATVVNDEQEILATNVLLYMKDVKVADAAQTTYSIGATYELLKGLKLYGTYFHADKLYAAFDLDQFLEAGHQVWELPSYGLMDAGLSYEFDVAGLGLELGLNVNHVLDEKYVSESLTNRIYNPEDAGDARIGNTRGSTYNQIYFGFGRTWNTHLKISF